MYETVDGDGVKYVLTRLASRSEPQEYGVISQRPTSYGADTRFVCVTPDAESAVAAYLLLSGQTLESLQRSRSGVHAASPKPRVGGERPRGRGGGLRR